MRWLSCSLLLLITGSPLAYGQEPQAGEIDLTAFDLTNETHRKVLSFCHIALLRERGFTCSPFAGSSDKWILENLLPDKRFLAALDESGVTSTYAPVSPMAKQVPRGNEGFDGAIVSHYQKQDRSTDRLLEQLTPDRVKRLPGVYLHVEGLTALCRPDFAKMFDNAETQDRISKLAQETWSNRASEIHRALFGLKGGDDAPMLEVDLRKVSYELDLRIAALLTAKELERLADLLSESWVLHKVVRCAPAY